MIPCPALVVCRLQDVYNEFMTTVRVLLADDHAVVRAGIANAIQELADLEIVGEVGDGPSLFQALARTQPDCLLIDVTMPGFDPVAAIRQIRARYPEMRILVVSAHDDDIYVQGLLGAGVDGYHLKDQPLSDLRLAVQRVLAGERWLSSPIVDKLLRYGSQPPSTPLLTERQRDLLRLLEQGFDNQTIAMKTGLSVKTVENHLTRLYRQLNVQSRLEAVAYVLQHPQGLAGLGQDALQAPRIASELPQSISILLVDDNARYREQLCRMIAKIYRQANIYEAENSGQAVQLMQRVSPQLALVDVVLGDENGIQCVRKMRDVQPHARIILISAYPDREFHRLGLDAGAAAFLDKKDMDLATLRQVIDDNVGW
jgi:DNA-binding NarL/FixJ family response regulator